MFGANTGGGLFGANTGGGMFGANTGGDTTEVYSTILGLPAACSAIQFSTPPSPPPCWSSSPMKFNEFQCFSMIFKNFVRLDIPRLAGPDLIYAARFMFSVD